MKIKGNIKNILWLIFPALVLFLWTFVFSDYLLKIPRDFFYKADLTSVDNFFDIQQDDYIGEKFSQSEFYYEVVGRNGTNLLIKNVFDVKDLTGKRIFKSEPIYGINSLAGEHVSGLGDKDRQGFLFAPRHVKKTDTFKFWQPSSNFPLVMQFAGEEYLEGLRVYKFEKINNQEMDQTDLMHFVPGVPKEKGIKLASNLYIWVEPVSGYLVKMEDYSTDYYYYDMVTGKRLYPYNQFMNVFTQEAVVEQVRQAKIQKLKVLTIDYIIPIVFSIIWVLFLILKFNPGFSFKLNQKNTEISKTTMVFVLVMVIPIVGFILLSGYFAKSSKISFVEQTDEISRLIQKRSDSYSALLLGAHGLFDASQNVTRSEWRAYVDSINLNQNFPGVLGLGFAQVVTDKDKGKLISSVRQEGFKNFDIFPKGKRDIYTPIVYIEPFNPVNQKAFGYDMYSDSTRRKAINFSLTNNTPTASGKVVLVQEKGKENADSGFLVYSPVHLKNNEKQAFGYVYIPIRMSDFMKSIIQEKRLDFNFVIYDGLQISPDRQLFSSQKEKDSNQASNQKNDLYRSAVVYVAGHPWTIEYKGVLSDNYGGQNIFFPYAFLALGAILSILFSRIYYISNQSKNKAVKYAEITTANLQKNLVDLENTKKAMLNVLEDIEQEKIKAQKLANIVAASNEAIFSQDLNGVINEWNSGAEALYGWSSQDAIGQSISKIVPEDRQAEVFQIIDSIKNNRIIKNLETVHKKINGDLLNVSISAAPIKEPSGRVVALSVVIRNITKEKEIERAKNEFVSLAAHQLKTPVGAISWNLEMLLAGDYGKIAKKPKEIIEEVYKLSKRMAELVKGFLNISRIELGIFVIEPKKIDFMEVCEDVFLELKSKILEKSINITKEYHPAKFKAMADRTALRIIFQNLLSNAIKYTRQSGEVRVLISRDKNKIQLVVSDNGDGIPENDKEKIFSKMFRASNAQILDPDGNGLGLYLLKHIIEAAGGKIWFESVLKQGTTFFVEFDLPGMREKRGDKVLS